MLGRKTMEFEIVREARLLLVCVSQRFAPNLDLLRNALMQAGPWAGDETVHVEAAWLKTALSETIKRIDWKEAAGDVRRFLRPAELKSTDLWSDRFFLAKLEKL